ncbi:hypothetical protein ANCDUO_26197 [Ancylostoma duodenale]|uniref:CUB domain-containing protein n=1 Tax=Ancylostoma duodenale TaxID=51022 RepID=A0A0C2FFP5_9BILA|nr:hypothetical protein ANCDUO_26197 [Ancylostoma duodenale]
MWTVVLGSNRRIGYEILDLDLEKTEGCTTDSLAVGFKMRIFEISEDCNSENLFVDESEPSKTFRTPRYPGVMPHSLDCQYTLRAPNGHRLKFTVNPEMFRMEAVEDE